MQSSKKKRVVRENHANFERNLTSAPGTSLGLRTCACSCHGGRDVLTEGLLAKKRIDPAPSEERARRRAKVGDVNGNATRLIQVQVSSLEDWKSKPC